MGYRLIVICLGFALGLGASADFDRSKGYQFLPKGSKLKLKSGNARFYPRGTLATVADLGDDKDGDGALDWYDWCPETAAGSKVWTREDAKNKLCEVRHVGCSGAAGEKTVFDPANSSKTPSGVRFLCSLRVMPTSDDRVLSSTTELTVADHDISDLSEEEKNTLLGVYAKWDAPGLLLLTPAGTRVGLRCDSMNTQLIKGRDVEYYPDTSKYDSYPPVSAVERVFDIAIAPTIEIALKP